MCQSPLLDFDSVYNSIVRPYFGQVKDERGSNTVYTLADTLSSSFAMFSLKSPSLLNFEERTCQESSNVLSVYNIDKIPSDSQARNILDKVPTDSLHGLFPQLFEHLKKSGVVKDYHFLNRLIVSIDGTGFFDSGKIGCPYCLEKNLKSGKTRCSHSLLSAVLVHPSKSEVFPLANEPIARQDGDTKNDCERNAAKRLLKRLEAQYGAEKLIVVEDALYANGPHIKQVLGAGMDYIIGVKPAGNATLFSNFEAKKGNSQVKKLQYTDQGGNTHTFYYANDLRLNNSCEIDTNMVVYECKTKKGQIKKGSWITNLKLNKDNVNQVVKAAKARWKIENETFNTLKNQGYGFEHNYGHGKQYLANNFAILMMLAFLVDQMQQAGSKVFRTAKEGLKTKIKLWESLRAIFKLIKVNSMTEVLSIILEQYEIQYE